MPDKTDDDLPEDIAKRLKEATDKIALYEEKIKNVPNEEPPAPRYDPPGSGSADRNWRERKIAEYRFLIDQEKAGLKEDTEEMSKTLSPEKKAKINRAVDRALDPKDPQERKNIDEVSRSQEYINTMHFSQRQQEKEPSVDKTEVSQAKDDQPQPQEQTASRSDSFLQGLKYNQNKKDITEPDDPVPTQPGGRERD